MKLKNPKNPCSCKKYYKEIRLRNTVRGYEQLYQCPVCGMIKYVSWDSEKSLELSNRLDEFTMDKLLQNWQE